MNTKPPPLTITLAPGVPVKVHLGLTVSFTILYGLLFFLIMWQLLLILYHKHRRLSYQSLFLFTCLVWAGLRTTLFAFYFKNCELSNTLNPFCHWLLFALPVYLQYNMLSILVFYFVLVVAKVVTPTKLKKVKIKVFVVILLSNVLFLAANISSSLYNPSRKYAQTVVILRVSLDYSIFLCAALVLCYCIIKLTRVNSAKMFLEGQGVSFCQAITVCGIIALLYITRAIYNILAVSPIHMPTFNYGWINVSDQGEVGYDGIVKHTTEDYAFISFGIVLFIWELLPTFTTVWFFRVRQPDCRISSSSIKSDSFHSKSFFFDNPNRYDSDDDLSIAYNTPPGFSYGGLLDIPPFGSPKSYGSPKNRKSINEHSILRKNIDCYGSVPPMGNTASPASFASHHIRGTTPPLLYSTSADTTNPYRPVTQDVE
ncbi:G protein-coupled receptor 137Ba-like [Hydractinia symbiolongicarpus]|uniref:G protein-coupled receptor 137Ba-like n=1 Tax=Hydractinia symbiolongicarpus TaxID=13093 RepID=UPI00254BCAC0|nr:G protein-coupled receptor 137Ba-like [Hydractinia symbiolongicarpus]